MSSRIQLSTAVCAGLLVLLPGTGSSAQTVERVPATPTQYVAGSTTFKAYCAVCHGIGGKGDGPAAKALTVAPADLTRIEKRHEGRFPAVAVARIISGDDLIVAHGTREMPIWGPVFSGMEDRARAKLRLQNLVTYLESIQERF
jgi:mono/diheme cytochrome c family protein